MTKNIFFWGGKFKASIIYNLIRDNKILSDTKLFAVKYIFDPNLEKPQFSSDAHFSNKKIDLEKYFKDSEYFVVCIGNELGFARYSISKELDLEFGSTIDIFFSISNNFLSCSITKPLILTGPRGSNIC